MINYSHLRVPSTCYPLTLPRQSDPSLGRISIPTDTDQNTDQSYSILAIYLIYATIAMVRFETAFCSLLILALSGYACEGVYQCKYSTGAHCCILPGLAYTADNCPTACNGTNYGWEPQCVSGAATGHRHNCKCGAYKDKCTA